MTYVEDCLKQILMTSRRSFFVLIEQSLVLSGMLYLSWNFMENDLRALRIMSFVIIVCSIICI